MEIYDFTKRKDGQAGYMISVSSKEALRLIQSLTAQLADENPNSNRLESNATWTNGKKKKHDIYFSISVSEKK